MHNKCNAFELSPDHPPLPWQIVFHETAPWSQKSLGTPVHCLTKSNNCEPKTASSSPSVPSPLYTHQLTWSFKPFLSRYCDNSPYSDKGTEVQRGMSLAQRHTARARVPVLRSNPFPLTTDHTASERKVGAQQMLAG